MKKLTDKFAEAGKIAWSRKEKELLYKAIHSIVYSYPTKYKEGFLPSELADIKSKFHIINEQKYEDALYGITCMMSPEGETIIYHCDVEHALRCGIENRDLNAIEWD